MIAITFSESRVDLNSFLFGDLLAVSEQQLTLILTVAAAVIAISGWFWRPLVSLCVDPDMARVEGVSVGRMRLLMMVMIALVVGIAMQAVGVLLVTAMLVIPAATARRFATSPGGMALLAAVIGTLGVLFGFTAAWYADAPAGPSIVVAAFLLFLGSRIWRVRSF